MLPPLFAIVAALTAGSSEVAAEVPSMPWLKGLYGVRVTATGDDAVPGRMAPWSSPDLECAAGNYPGLELVADVAAPGGDERILAAYTQGVIVLGPEQQVLASTPGYTCEGSADDLVALAAGSTFLEPTIALAVTSGGRHEQITWVALYRVGFAGRLDPVFTASVEEREGEVVQRGVIAFIPGGLLYQRPGGGWSVWVFDDAGRAYVYRGPIEEPDEPPHIPFAAL